MTELTLTILGIVVTTVGTIATVVSAILQYQQNRSQKSSKWKVPKFLLRLSSLIIASIFITVVVMGIRSTGILQELELTTFDYMMKQRPYETPDRRLLAITVTEEDIQAPDNQNRDGSSLSDYKLVRLIERLKADYEPKTIGLDIYLNSIKNSELVNLLERDNQIFATCKVSNPENDDPGIPPPESVPSKRLGFSDVVEDRDGIVRRHLLYMNPPPQSQCFTRYAFNFQIANHYLGQQDIKIDQTESGKIKVGDRILKPLDRSSTNYGGYQNIDADGYQVMLNYRSYKDINQFVDSLTLADVLNTQKNQNIEELKGRIVLVGVTAPNSTNDYWRTPYTAGDFRKEIPGVILQAHMISQILSFSLDNRPLVWTLPSFLSPSLVWTVSLASGLLFGFVRSIILRGLLGGLLLGFIYWFCLYTLTQGGWLPFIPSLIASILTGLGIVGYRWYQRRQEQ